LLDWNDARKGKWEEEEGKRGVVVIEVMEKRSNFT
jgi:hypothetical protein